MIGYFLFTLSANAQSSFDDLDRFEEGWLKIAYRYTSLNGKYTEKFSGSTLDIAIRSDRCDPWALRYSFEYPLLGDAIFNLAKEVKDFNNGTQSVGLNQTLTNGWIGGINWPLMRLLQTNCLFRPGLALETICLQLKLGHRQVKKF